MSVLSSFSKRLDALGDRVNPIVVKETRQAVRSRAVVSVLSLFVVVLVIAAMGVLLFSSSSRSAATEGVGWEIFLLFNSILLLLCGVFVPIYVAIRAAGDRSGVAADLLFTTTIRPASVIWGKLAAGMLVTMLLFATATPFVTVSYLLRGIDLPTIAYWLAFDALIIFLAIQVAVFIAVIPTSIVIRVIMGLVTLIAGLWMVSAYFAFVQFMGETSVSVYDNEDWMIVGTTTSLFLLGAGLLFVLSVACVSPNASNRAFLPRFYITAAMVLSYAVLLVTTVMLDDIEVMLVWFYGWLYVLLVATLISSGERREPGLRVLQSKLLRWKLTRRIGILFSSGAFAGLGWCIVMTGLLVAGLFGSESLTDLFSYSVWSGMDWDNQVAETSVAAFVAIVMAVSYNMFAIALRDGPLKRFSKGTVMTPAITMLLIAAVSLAPPIGIALMGDTRDLDNESISLLNPVSSLIWYDSDMHGLRLMIAAVIFAASLLLAWKPVRRSFSAYRRPPESTRKPVVEPDQAPDEQALVTGSDALSDA